MLHSRRDLDFYMSPTPVDSSSHRDAPSTISQMPRAPLWRALAALILSVAANVFVKLSIAAMVINLVVGLSLPKKTDAKSRSLYHSLVAVTAFLTIVSLFRFTLNEAIPGVLEGGMRAVTLRGNSRLREVLFAEDILREQAQLDHDGDGIGSAATLPELLGAMPLRSEVNTAKHTDFVPLQWRGSVTYVPDPQNPQRKIAVISLDGMCFTVYIPTQSGQWTTVTDDLQNPIDEEAAERRLVAYSWPAQQARGNLAVVYIDERERILQSDNTGTRQGYIGCDHPPPVDAVEHDGGVWSAWKNKKPRDAIPGLPAISSPATSSPSPQGNTP